MKIGKIFLKFILLCVILLGLPLAGIYSTGIPVSQYLEFPPKNPFISHHGFSWPIFVAIAMVIAGIVIPIYGPLVLNSPSGVTSQKRVASVFPWWGWISLACVIIAWAFAWNRFTWFDRFQAHTFSMLWYPFIVLINAVEWKRTGKCLMLQRPRYFISLFPLSAGFWWFFEYLNRFVQNWYYVNSNFGALEYFMFATMSFSTVLPAVLSMKELVLSFSKINGIYGEFIKVKGINSRPLAFIVLVASCLSLYGIGLWPDFLFPFLWIAPLLIITCLQSLLGMPNIFIDLYHGRWTDIISVSLAAIICGWFWEMWNYWSFAKWEYSIPFVGRFHVFEMPILGYAGYLPFGIECLVVARMIEVPLSHVKGSQGDLI